jgi:RNA polymerase sigma-70 factor, ECF subfamily
VSHSIDPDVIDLFEAWYERDLPRLYRYVWYRVRDQALAEELTAATCERALQILDRYDPARGGFDAWMFGIAHNEVRSALRSQRRRPALLSLDALPWNRGSERPVEQQVARREAFDRLIGLIAALPEPDQAVVALRYGAGLSNPEIAQITDLTPNHVAVRLHRALKKLREALAAEQAGAEE